jgi:hypothetical protein
MQTDQDQKKPAQEGPATDDAYRGGGDIISKGGGDLIAKETTSQPPASEQGSESQNETSVRTPIQPD